MLKTLKFKSQFTRGVGRKHFSEPKFLLGSISRQCFSSLLTAQTRAIFMAEDSKHPIPPLSQTAWGRPTTTCQDSKRPQELFIINELFTAALIQIVFFSWTCFLPPSYHLCSAYSVRFKDFTVPSTHNIYCKGEAQGKLLKGKREG